MNDVWQNPLHVLQKTAWTRTDVWTERHSEVVSTEPVRWICCTSRPLASRVNTAAKDQMFNVAMVSKHITLSPLLVQSGTWNCFLNWTQAFMNSFSSTCVTAMLICVLCTALGCCRFYQHNRNIGIGKKYTCMFFATLNNLTMQKFIEKGTCTREFSRKVWMFP